MNYLTIIPELQRVIAQMTDAMLKENVPDPGIIDVTLQFNTSDDDKVVESRVAAMLGGRTDDTWSIETMSYRQIIAYSDTLERSTCTRHSVKPVAPAPRQKFMDAVLKAATEYADEAEHQDGAEYWDQFKDDSDMIQDFYLYLATGHTPRQ